MNELTQEYLKQILHYESETGVWTWVIHQGQRAKIGQQAGTINSEGYRNIIIDGKQYRAHRLAWLYMTGEWPKEQIDHINHKPDDNCWTNLREATGTQNKQNSQKYKNNTSGIKGVSWYKPLAKWRADIRVNGELIYLGLFDLKDEAAESYQEAAQKFFGEFANTQETQKERIYLAGKMRGVPRFNAEAFIKAASYLRSIGYEVFSPHEHDVQTYGKEFFETNLIGDNEQAEQQFGFSLRKALGIDMKWICKYADGIALLPGWIHSKGAVAEKATAEALGLKILPLCVDSEGNYYIYEKTNKAA